MEPGPLPLRHVADIADVPIGRGLRVEVDGVAVALFRVDDAIHAMEDVCPHAGLPLSDGTLEGCVVTCRAHGWPFDVRTGFAPDDADGFPVPCFAVELRGGAVHVDVSDQVNDPRRRRKR